MARHQLAQRDERKAQGSFCCSPRAGCRRSAAADQGQGSATSARRPSLADRRTQNIGREEILSRQPAGEDEPAHLGERHQGAMDLRAGSPATERRTRSRSLRGPILARTASSRAHDDDRLRFPPVSPAQNRKAGKKESTGRRLSQPCPPCARPASKSSLDHCRGDVPTAENGFATRYSMNKSAKVVLGGTIFRAALPSDYGRSKRTCELYTIHHYSVDVAHGLVLLFGRLGLNNRVGIDRKAR